MHQLSKAAFLSALIPYLVGCTSVTPIKSLTPITVSTRPPEEPVPEEYKEDVAFIHDVREFGFEKLGLYSGSNHFKHYNDGSKTPPRSLYNLLVTKTTIIPDGRSHNIPITSLQAYRMDIADYAYFWSHSDTLEDERDYYQKEGYDVFWRTETSYNSTIDHKGSPITPEFLSKEKLSQAHTIEHEICHDTIKKQHGTNFPASIDEAYCSMVERAGAMLYFKERQGEQSPSYLAAVVDLENHLQFSAQVNSLWKRLDTLYVNPKLTEDEKLQQREKLLVEARELLQRPEADNADIWDWYTYTKHYPFMIKFYRSYGDVATTMKLMEMCPKTEEGAVKYMAGLIETKKIKKE